MDSGCKAVPALGKRCREAIAKHLEGMFPMKILVLPKPREDVPRDVLQQYAAEEIQAVWDLYAQGIVREFYVRAAEPGRVVLVVESATAESAKEALVALPFVRHDMIELELIPLAPFVGLTRLFQAAS